MTFGNVLSLLKSPVAWMVLLLVLALNQVGKMDLEDAINAEKNYCDRVAEWKESGGQYGWPPYRDDVDCPLDSNAG